MSLVLAPSFDDHTRAEIEAHIEQVRSRRMLAAITYHEGINAKLSYESDKIQERIKKQYVMLAKELEQFDRAHEKLENRMAGIEHLMNELGLVIDMKETHAVPTEKEDE